MQNEHQTLFRKETLERISSPEQLGDYLRVTSAGIWVVLAAVILLLAGLFVWSAVGTLETTADVKVIVEDENAQVVPMGSEKLQAGMTLRILGEDSIITSAEKDNYGRSIGSAKAGLPDGIYDGTVVTESVHPIQFLLKSR